MFKDIRSLVLLVILCFASLAGAQDFNEGQ